jgi:osmoprotectant transport system permease protein
VASIIGVPQLGQLFVAGNNNNTLTPIILGLIVIIALALVFDGVIVTTVRLMTPWRRAVAGR